MCEIDAWPGGAASCGRLVCACSALVVEREAQGVVIEPGLVPLARRLLSLPRFLLRASLLLRLPAVSVIGPSAYGDISRYFESSQGRFQALFLGVKVKHRLSVGGALHVAAHDVVEKGVDAVHSGLVRLCSGDPMVLDQHSRQYDGSHI